MTRGGKTAVQRDRGAALVLVMGFLAVITISVGSFLSLLHASMNYAHREEARARAVHSAEAGLEKALAEFRAGREDYKGESGTPVGDGAFSVSVRNDGGSHTIISTGKGVSGAAAASVSLEAQARVQSGRVVKYHWREVEP